jgi:hypothetical protein
MPSSVRRSLRTILLTSPVPVKDFVWSEGPKCWQKLTEGHTVRLGTEVNMQPRRLYQRLAERTAKRDR